MLNSDAIKFLEELREQVMDKKASYEKYAAVLNRAIRIMRESERKQVTCKECRFFDGSCCRKDSLFRYYIDSCRNRGPVFFRMYVNEDDFCSDAERGEYIEEEEG